MEEIEEALDFGVAAPARLVRRSRNLGYSVGLGKCSGKRDRLNDLRHELANKIHSLPAMAKNQVCKGITVSFFCWLPTPNTRISFRSAEAEGDWMEYWSQTKLRYVRAKVAAIH